MSEGRAKRTCTVRAKGPSSTHYVGYVEDDETPEAIMKKFEALERVQTGVAGAAEACGLPEQEGEQQLTEAQLLEVFKQTSMFTVRSAMQELVHQEQGGDDDDPRYSEEEEEDDLAHLADFWADEEAEGEPRKRRGGGVGRAPAGAREPKAQKLILTAYNRDNQMLLRRKKVVDPYELALVKLPPPPLPSSWGRVIKPYCPASARALALALVPDSAVVTLPRVLAHSLPPPSGGFLGVLMNAPWGALQPAQLGALGLPALCPLGFLFIWVEKEALAGVVDAVGRLGYVYVENLTWVLLTPAHRPATAPAPFLARAHRTLLIFRRDTREHPRGKEVELRHQRSPDVEVGLTNSAADGRLLTPEAAYAAIETLLPGGYTPGQPGRFLELWAYPEIRRPGWTHVVEATQS